MTAKSFLFVAAWMQPLKALPLEQRWNVIEAIMEYSISGEVNMPLDPMETLAFGFIRNEIDRMNSYRAERRETRRAAPKSRYSKEKGATNKPEETAFSDTNDANACNAKQADGPYYILSESKSKSESESESESEKKSSSTSSHARVRGGAGKNAPYYDSQLLPRFFDSSNQAKLEALAMKHHVSIETLKTMAEEITVQWALTDKTHESYHDAASHLMFALNSKAQRERNDAPPDPGKAFLLERRHSFMG